MQGRGLKLSHARRPHHVCPSPLMQGRGLKHRLSLDYWSCL